MSGDYLNPEELQADVPDEPPPTVDARYLDVCRAQLLAAREAIDATIACLDAAMAGPRPMPVAQYEEEEECNHHPLRRVSLNTIGSGDDRPRWRCRDCGYTHEP